MNARPKGVLLVVASAWWILAAPSPGPQRDDPKTVALAEQLDRAATSQDRDTILASNTITPDLPRVCMERGRAFARQSNPDRAMQSFQSALAAALLLPDHAEAARAYGEIGLIRYRQGRASEALGHYEKSVSEAKLTPDKGLVAESLRRTGVAQRSLGNFAAAFAIDEECLRLYRELNDTMGVIKVLNGFGNSYARTGALRKAAENFEECARLGESIHNAEAIYRSVESLGNVYMVQGDAALSLSYLEKALALRQEANASKRELATSFVNLIVGYRLNNRLDDALHAAGLSLQLSREAGDEMGVAYALLNRAAVYRQMHRSGDALSDVRASLAISERNKTPLEIAAALSTIAELELDLKHPAPALASAQRAADLARSIPSPELLWKALETQGLAHQSLANPRLARAAFAEGAATVDEMRKQVAGGEEQGLEFLRDKMALYHGLMTLHLEFGDTVEALRAAERAKAGLILDVLRAGHAGITKAMTVLEKDREQQLVARLSALQTQTRRDAPVVERASRELAAFRAELYAAHPELKIRRGESEPLDMAGAALLLPDPHTALLEFAVTPDTTWLFALTRGEKETPELRVHKLPWKADTLTRDVEAFRKQLANRDPAYRTAAAALYRGLLAPAAASLTGKTLLAIIPDGPLWGLPFQALVGPSGRHVVEDRAVFYAPSLTALMEGVRSRRPPSDRARTVLAMGDPEAGKQHPGLPNAVREVQTLGRLYGAGSVTLTGAQASEMQWKKQAPHHRVLHLATHGVLNSSNPLYSYVLLSPGHGEDGFVEGREILDLDLNAELVILSACETGRGGFHYGEGLVGMSWALMVAGSPASVVSQWKVDSASTTELMLGFHRELRPRTLHALSGKAAALRTASLRLRQNSAFGHPYYWAGFAIVGDGY